MFFWKYVSLLWLYESMIEWLAGVPSISFVAFGTDGQVFRAPFLGHQHQRSMWESLQNLLHHPCFSTGLHSGKHTKSYRKSPFWIGKSIINGVCSIAMLNYQRVMYKCRLVLSMMTPDRLLVTMPRASRTLGFNQLSGQVGQHPISLDTWLLRRQYSSFLETPWPHELNAP